jgi:TonB family protein
MIDHTAESGFLAPRAIVAGGILALHIAVAYLLATSLAPRILVLPKYSMAGVVIEQPRTAPPPPPTIEPPKFQPPRVDYVRPDIVIPDAPESGTVLTGLPLPPPTAAPLAPQPDPVLVLGKHRLPDTEEYYPPDLRRAGIQGAANIRVCVDERGIRQGEPTVEKSSGNDRLDLGALNVARHGRYARAVQGGSPVANCYRFKINFKIIQ